jgi:hypothetical protein
MGGDSDGAWGTAVESRTRARGTTVGEGIRSGAERPNKQCGLAARGVASSAAASVAGVQA